MILDAALWVRVVVIHPGSPCDLRTNATFPVALFVNDCIVERVATFAKIRTNSHRSGSVASPNVLTLCDGLKVCRIATGPDATKMVDLHSYRDRSDQLFICQSVSTYVTSVHPDSGVAVAVGCKGRNPAITFHWPCDNNDPRHEAIYRISRIGASSTIAHRWTSLGSDRSRGRYNAARLTHCTARGSR